MIPETIDAIGCDSQLQGTFFCSSIIRNCNISIAACEIVDGLLIRVANSQYSRPKILRSEIDTDGGIAFDPRHQVVIFDSQMIARPINVSSGQCFNEAGLASYERVNKQSINYNKRNIPPPLLMRSRTSLPLKCFSPV